MTHLNEEKRRTEGQIHIFDIYSEIENCPASVVSSHRRCGVVKCGSFRFNAELSVSGGSDQDPVLGFLATNGQKLLIALHCIKDVVGNCIVDSVVFV
jgi:hypothetical protein